MVKIYNLFHPTTTQYTFFSAPHGTFSKIDHILGHNADLNKFKEIRITPCIISDHKGINVDLKNKGNHRKYSNTWRLNNTLLKNQWMTKVLREEIKNFLESNENQNTSYQNQVEFLLGLMNLCACSPAYATPS
jgi:hypothetical protein